MGKLLQGIFGPITGRVGDMIYYSLNGQIVSRHVGKRDKPFSEAQLASQARMRVVNVFLKTFGEVLRIGFMTNDKISRDNAFNRAVSYNRINAVAGIYPYFEVDYSKVLVSRGVLPVAMDARVELVAEGLKFDWLYVADLPYPRENDRVMMLAFFPGLGSAVYSLDGACRKARTDVLVLAEELLAEPMAVYIAFAAADGKSVSDSVYLGHLNS